MGAGGSGWLTGLLFLLEGTEKTGGRGLPGARGSSEENPFSLPDLLAVWARAGLPLGAGGWGVQLCWQVQGAGFCCQAPPPIPTADKRQYRGSRLRF